MRVNYKYEIAWKIYNTNYWEIRSEAFFIATDVYFTFTLEILCLLKAILPNRRDT